MHALVIEDDAFIAMMIEDELHDLGYASVDIATTEQEAIDSVARKCPDLVTSDGSLLRGSGVGAVSTIHADFAVPVVFITGDAETPHRCIPEAPVVEKPFSIPQLIAAVAQATSLHA